MHGGGAHLENCPVVFGVKRPDLTAAPESWNGIRCQFNTTNRAPMNPSHRLAESNRHGGSSGYAPAGNAV